MKIALKLAYRNLAGAGLRTWLNVGVLAFSFLMILFFNALIDGWNAQAKVDSINWEFGHGQVQHTDYDPLNPFSIEQGHGAANFNTENLEPILIRQATIYPNGRMYSALLKGIDPKQKTIDLPTEHLVNKEGKIAVIIGKKMAKSCHLKEGDELVLRWRDKNGTFDARPIYVAHIYETNVATSDKGLLWIDINQLWKMTQLEGHASYYVASENYKHTETDGWRFLSQEYLLKDITEIIEMKKVSGSFMYLLLLSIALLAVFDTQVLSVFRRQKEIGTYIALGMTRFQVVQLFTVEGSMYSLLAVVVGTLLGIPLFLFLGYTGIQFPETTQDMGVTMAPIIYPLLSLKLVLITVALVVLSATIVSFLPARKIAKMNPVDALKGKLQ